MSTTNHALAQSIAEAVMKHYSDFKSEFNIETISPIVFSELEKKIDSFAVVDKTVDIDDIWQFGLQSGDEFTFENKVYVVLSIEWDDETASMRVNHIDSGFKRITCHYSEIS